MAADRSPEDEVDPREGNLGQLTDEEWLAGHRFLQQLVADDPDFPSEELAYLYDPERPADTVTVDDLTTDRDPAEPDDLPDPVQDEFR
jgi:hypothetical protein